MPISYWLKITGAIANIVVAISLFIIAFLFVKELRQIKIEDDRHRREGDTRL